MIVREVAVESAAGPLSGFFAAAQCGDARGRVIAFTDQFAALPVQAGAGARRSAPAPGD